jgi:hypothetical protein
MHLLELKLSGLPRNIPKFGIPARSSAHRDEECCVLRKDRSSEEANAYSFGNLTKHEYNLQ